MRPLLQLVRLAVWPVLLFAAGPAAASTPDSCAALPSPALLRAALVEAQAQPKGGLGVPMWASIVDRDGVVCAVVMTGDNRGDQWPGSRIISAQKANTANAARANQPLTSNGTMLPEFNSLVWQTGIS